MSGIDASWQDRLSTRVPVGWEEPTCWIRARRASAACDPNPSTRYTKIMQVVARRYDTRSTVSIRIEDHRIQGVKALNGAYQGVDLPWVAPGFVDLQVNGHSGRDFADRSLTVEDVESISKALDRDGVTSYCPTVTTHSFDRLRHAMQTIAQACEESADVADRVDGIHLEGPYTSAEEGPRGAHPAEHVRPPDWDEFQRLQEAAGGRIRILTMSPEHEGASQFISKVADTDVVVAIGHTSADTDQIKAAVEAGARLSTHLGNGAHGRIRRHPNYIWDQLAEDRLVASLIVDGHHLPPAVVKTLVRAKSPERCILVSDITGMAGMPPGHYRNSSLGDVEVSEDGRLFIAGQQQLLAGAALPLRKGIANILRYADQDLRSAVDMASTRPSSLIGREPTRLEAGGIADLTLFHLPGADANGPVGDLEVIATVNAGELVFGSLPLL